MGLWLSSNWRQELARWRLSGKLPHQELEALWPPQHDAGQPSAMLPNCAEYAAIETDLEVLASFPAPYTQPSEASNEWAVDGSRSATGAPLLAGDPHLAFGFPGLWYLARIDTPDETLAGATAPGIPGIVLGHNRDIAWTFTNTGADVQDIFIETPVVPGRVPDARWTEAVHHAPRDHPCPRSARCGPDGARDAAWPGDR